jgi:hypothetical protein
LHDFTGNYLPLSQKKPFIEHFLRLLLLICSFLQELETKRKERAQLVYERKKQLAKLRLKAEKTAEEKLGPQQEIIAPLKY